MSHLTSEPRSIREVLRAGLTERMRARDTAAVSAIRNAIAAIDNAEAVPVDAEAQRTAGPVVGVGGASETSRAVLDEETMRALVTAEADEFADLSRRLGEAGASDGARTAFEQASLLRFLLDVAAPPEPSI